MLKEKTINVGKDLFGLKKSEIEKKYILKEELDQLAEVMASILDLRDKEGEVQVSQIKLPLLKEAFLIVKQEKKNALEERFNILEEYITILENNKEVEAFLEKLNRVQIQVEDIKIEKKAIKKEVELTEAEATELDNLDSDDKEWMKFIDVVVKEKSEEIEEKEKEKYLNNKGKEKKSNSSIVKELFEKEEIKRKIS